MSTLNVRVIVRAVNQATAPLRAVRNGLAGLEKPGQAAGMVLQSIGRDLRNLGLLGSAVFAGLGMGAWNLTRRIANQGEEALLMSEKTGVSVRSVQRLGYAFKLANVEGEAFETGLKFLNVSLDAAGRGSKADLRAFDALGVSIRDARGQLRPTEDVLIDVADQMEKMPAGAEKTALAMAIFGRSGTDMIPGLSQGGAAIKKLGDEAEAAGVVMSEQAAKEFDAFNDGVDKLKTEVNGLGVGIGTALLPMLTKGVAQTRAWIGANRPAVIAKVTEVVQVLSTSLPPLFDAFFSIVKVLGDLAKVLGPIVRAIGGFGMVLDGLAALMIGRLALAIWTAVKAVWGLNGAMLANPVGLVIAGLAGLVVAGWLLVRNWGRISKGWADLWARMNEATAKVASSIRGAFKGMVDAIWNLFPNWLKTLFKVGRYVVSVVGTGFGGANGRGGPAAPPPSFRPNVSRAAPLNPSAAIRVTLEDRRPPAISVRGQDGRVNFLTESIHRGAFLS